MRTGLTTHLRAGTRRPGAFGDVARRGMCCIAFTGGTSKGTPSTPAKAARPASPPFGMRRVAAFHRELVVAGVRDGSDASFPGDVREAGDRGGIRITL